MTHVVRSVTASGDEHTTRYESERAAYAELNHGFGVSIREVSDS